MGFVSETLSGVEGIQWYYIVGIILFIGLFIGVVIHTYTIPKKELMKFKSSIFDQEEVGKEGNGENEKMRW
jgi:hypothetical protein